MNLDTAHAIRQLTFEHLRQTCSICGFMASGLSSRAVKAHLDDHQRIVHPRTDPSTGEVLPAESEPGYGAGV